MAAAKRKKEGLVAFAAGVIAAPLVGVAAVAFVVGLGLIWYASRDDTPEPEDEFVLGFAEPDDIQATEIPGEKRTRRRSQPRPRSTSPSPRSSSAPSSRSSSPPSPSGDTPAMPTPPELREEGSLPPGSAPPADGEVVDIADLEPAERAEPTDGANPDANPATGGPAPSGTPKNPFAPPEVAAADPEPERTRTRSSTEPGPHDFPEDDGDSWIPDTFRGIVESGVAMLTGAPAEPDEAPAMPDASAEQAEATPRTRTDDGDSEDSEDESDGVAAVSPEPSSERSAPTPGATPRPEDAASVTPTGRGEPDASVVPETSAMPAADEDDEPMPFAPVAPVAPQPTPIPATRGPAPSGTPTAAPGTPDPAPEASSTFDDLVSGGLDMVTGKGAPVVAPAPTRTRTRTEMEEDVAGYTDPVAEGSGTPIALEDDLSVDIEEHDEAASFGTPTADDEVDITEALELDDIVIPVRVQTATPGVPVRIDGKDLGVSPARSDLSDGDHTVVVGSGADATTFTITPMANPDVWCFDTKSAGGYRQVPCD